jgi:hypothetical protein
MMRQVIGTILALGIACTAAGCVDAPWSDVVWARRAVARYNAALVEAYRRGDAVALAGVASEAERSRVAGVIEGLRARGLVMEARQESSAIEAVRRPLPDLVEVDALERWRYVHRPLTRGPGAPERTVEYRMTYQVRKQPSGWVVAVAVER